MSAKLIDIRCSCGKLLGRVQEGAAHEHKCPRCKEISAYLKHENKKCPVCGGRHKSKLRECCTYCNNVRRNPKGTRYLNTKTRAKPFTKEENKLHELLREVKVFL